MFKLLKLVLIAENVYKMQGLCGQGGLTSLTRCLREVLSVWSIEINSKMTWTSEHSVRSFMWLFDSPKKGEGGCLALLVLLKSVFDLFFNLIQEVY